MSRATLYPKLKHPNLWVVLTFSLFLQLRAEMDALQHTVAELEKERDFYYGKLRSVELLCQTTEESPQGRSRSRSRSRSLSRARALSLAPHQLPLSFLLRVSLPLFSILYISKNEEALGHCV